MSYLENIAKHKRRLGRDKDPRVPSDINRISLWFRKITWILLTAPSLRIMTKLIYSKSTISQKAPTQSLASTGSPSIVTLVKK